MWKPRRSSDLRPSPVRVIDLSERHLSSYLTCLEDWSLEMKEAGDHKEHWYDQVREQGLRVKLAVDEQDQPLGMIQYVPIDLSPAQGEDLYVILCIWVHGYKQGVGDVQGQGIGSAMLTAAENDVRTLGAKGIAAWGLHLPVWMKSSWFKKHGYTGVDRIGVRELVWKPFVSDAKEPRWVEEQPVAVGKSGKVEVTAFQSGWCPAANLVYERARRASAEFGAEVQFTTIDTSDREAMLRCGHSDEVLLDGKPLQRSAPPSYKIVRRRIAKQVKRHKTPT